MVSYRKSAPNKPWHARARRGTQEISLGYFATRDEAVAEERLFDKEWPKQCNTPRRTHGGNDDV